MGTAYHPQPGVAARRRIGWLQPACPEGNDTEPAFLEALRHVHAWKITGQHLELFDAAGNLVTRFEARHMK
jgi:hypothetical protein